MHCVLCGSEWYVVPTKCSQCENTKEIGYYGLKNSHKAIRAEACPQCCCYLKILFRELDIDVDPVADDIATLDLDMLLTKEKGYINTGINFFML